MRTASIVFLSTVALIISLGALPQVSPELAKAGLDLRIPAPDPAQYRAIREAPDWLNPYLDVSNDGYRLTSISLPDGKFVAPEDLRRALTELPIGDWPHGRVAVVQSPSVVPGDEEWIAEIRRNVDTAIKILMALDADRWAWPA